MTSTSRLRERLARAQASRALVQIIRSPRHADRVNGFPLATGSKWVLVSQTGDGGYLEGLVAVRLRDVVKVRSNRSFEGRFAQTQPTWPPTPPDVMDLDTTGGLVRSLSRVSPLVGIEQERRYDKMLRWIGVVEQVGGGWLWLHEVRPDATWHEEPLGYKLKHITKVVISDRYLTALADVAGTTPDV
jgi:hypothetical protein